MIPDNIYGELIGPAKPYSACSNGCGVPAKWLIKRNGKTRNMCNTCATLSHVTKKPHSPKSKSELEKIRKNEVLERLGYDSKRS